jgi:hypothetical protein
MPKHAASNKTDNNCDRRPVLPFCHPDVTPFPNKTSAAHYGHQALANTTCDPQERYRKPHLTGQLNGKNLIFIQVKRAVATLVTAWDNPGCVVLQCSLPEISSTGFPTSSYLCGSRCDHPCHKAYRACYILCGCVYIVIYTSCDVHRLHLSYHRYLIIKRYFCHASAQFCF